MRLLPGALTPQDSKCWVRSQSGPATDCDPGAGAATDHTRCCACGRTPRRPACGSARRSWSDRRDYRTKSGGARHVVVLNAEQCSLQPLLMFEMRSSGRDILTDAAEHEKLGPELRPNAACGIGSGDRGSPPPGGMPHPNRPDPRHRSRPSTADHVAAMCQGNIGTLSAGRHPKSRFQPHVRNLATGDGR